MLIVQGLYDGGQYLFGYWDCDPQSVDQSVEVNRSQFCQQLNVAYAIVKVFSQGFWVDYVKHSPTVQLVNK